MPIVLGLLYILAGILLAIPYCLLAGWDEKNFLMVAYVAPTFLFVWLVVAIVAGIIEPCNRWIIHLNWRASFDRNNRQAFPYSVTVFWVWTIYCFLPIILHWSAVLLGKIGYETVASLIDMHRYASPFYVFMVGLIPLIIIVMVAGVLDAMKKMYTRVVHR